MPLVALHARGCFVRELLQRIHRPHDNQPVLVVDESSELGETLSIRASERQRLVRTGREMERIPSTCAGKRHTSTTSFPRIGSSSFRRVALNATVRFGSYLPRRGRTFATWMSPLQEHLLSFADIACPMTWTQKRNDGHTKVCSDEY